MKIDARRIAETLRRPQSHQAALVFGPDEGLVRERVLAMTRALLCGEGDDPFRLLDIAARDLREKDTRALANELATLPMTGGQRVVRVRDVTDRLAPVVQAALAPAQPGFLLLSAGELPGSSSLRKLVEASPSAAAIACYPPDAAAIAAMAQARFREDRIVCSDDALEILGERLEGETGMARQAIELVALHTGPGGRLGPEEVLALLGDHGAVALDEAILDAFQGRLAEADHGLARALADGSSAVAVLRTALRWAQRLQAMRAEIEAGASVAAAMKAARPPVFWKLTSSVDRALCTMDGRAIEARMERLLEAERACKRTGAPDQVLAMTALLATAPRPRL